ncbi:hypothetical protein [Amycolatopsis magusensis]|uniref:Serine/threonine protein kinase n=1 Tax=Amycolatopsis magusensis TaxID=882444 RepID=A0ABS4PPE3_9PSEU|nr:hypothetical protein [Amycolatopsis magusensis]MBP2180698.1 hypothetical protein [Amycolatopsis magusensis]MDI5980151.1 hypothetical protein [Amycolatopsis magusensis]
MSGPKPAASIVVTAVLAVLVTAAALVTAVLLRPDAPDVAAPGAGGESSTAGVASECGPQACQVLVRQPVKGTTAELLADPEGGAAHVRFGGLGSDFVLESALAPMEVAVGQDSLQCVDAELAACLVQGDYQGGVLAELLVAPGDTWRQSDRLYFSDAGRVLLAQVVGDPAPEVVVVRHECASAAPAAPGCTRGPVLAEVFELSGKQAGCTKRYSAPSQLRGWPDVRLGPADLRPCPVS